MRLHRTVQFDRKASSGDDVEKARLESRRSVKAASVASGVMAELPLALTRSYGHAEAIPSLELYLPANRFGFS